jgi:hypothetical protein
MSCERRQRFGNAPPRHLKRNEGMDNLWIILAQVVPEPDAIRLCNSSPMSWTRLKQIGDAPPVTQISPRRVGYRLIDLIRWLDKRRRSQGGESTPASLAEELEMIRAAVKLAAPAERSAQ